MAWDYGTAMGRKGFSKVKQIAGRAWFQAFLRRHKDIRKKKGKNLSINRAMCSNPVNINRWFNLYEATLDRMGIRDQPMQIWNLDETGFQDIPKERPVVGPTGEEVCQTVPGEKGETSTCIAMVNGIGVKVPPMILHKGGGKSLRVHDAWNRHAPTHVAVRATPNGFVTRDVFLEFMERTIRWMRGKRLLDAPNLLLLDGHKSHVYNVKFLKLCMDNNITVLCLPPHTSATLQPLDKFPFSNLKGSWQRELIDWIEDNTAKRLAKADFFSLFWPAWVSSMTINAIQSAYRVTGICPVNRNAIPKSKLTKAIVYDNRNDDTEEEEEEDELPPIPECECVLCCRAVVFV